jgi:hypothetical protein
VWVVTRAGYYAPYHLDATSFQLGRDWWHVFTAPFTYYVYPGISSTGTGVYQFATLFAVALFGWLIERRHGPLAVLVLFVFGASGGIYVALALKTLDVAAGGNGGALALLCAWAVPDLLARRHGDHYDGDLLGTGVIALVLLAMPIARSEASAVAGAFGVVAGCLGGLALARRAAD